MRIAICLSGHVRSYSKTFHEFESAILKPNAEHEIDIFISTWTTTDANVSGHIFRTKVVPPMVPVDFIDICEKYNPKIMHIDHTIDLSHMRSEETYQTHMRPGTVPIAIFSMFYKMGHADFLRQSYQKIKEFTYDRVIRTRFDLSYPKQYPITDYDPNILYLPPMVQHEACDWSGRQWYNDKFAIASDANMQHYAKLHDNINQIWDDGIPLQPEIMLREHLQRGNVPVSVLEQDPEIIR